MSINIQVQSVASQYNIGQHVPKESFLSPPIPKIHKPWGEFLHSLLNQIDDEDRIEDSLRHRKWLTMLRFYQGRQAGFINMAGQWQDIMRQPGDPIYISNIFQFYVNEIIKECVRSNAVIDVKAVGDRYEMQAGAKVFSALVKEIQRQTWLKSEKQREAKFAVLCGNAFRRSFVTDNHDLTQSVPIIDYVKKTIGEGIYTCMNGECSMMGPESELGEGGTCQYCGTPGALVRSAPEIEVPITVGHEDIPMRRIDTMVISPFAQKMDMHSRGISTSSYVRSSSLVLLEALQHYYPWATFGNGTPNEAMAYMREMERSPGNWDGSGQTSPASLAQDGSLVQQDEYWLEPERYCFYEFPEDTEMANGEIVKAGTKALELYQRGMRITRAGRVILDIRPERKNSVWDHWTWDLQPETAYGLGVEHAIEGQRDRNEFMSLMKEAMLAHTAKSAIVNQLKIKRSSLLNKPGHIAVMNNPSPQDNPANFIHHPQPHTVGPDLVRALEEQKGDFSLLTGGTFTLSSPQSDIKTETYGGLAIIRDAAMASLGPRLELKAECDVFTCRKWCEFISQDPWLAESYYTRISDYSEIELESFRLIKPGVDLEVKYRENSWMPRSELELRNDVIEPLTVGNLPGGLFNPMVPEHIRKLGLERFNLPLEANEAEIDERYQRIEIHDLLMIAQAALGQGLNEQQAILLARKNVPVKIIVDNHDAHVAHIIKFLRTDKGRKAHPMVQLLLMDHIQQHFQAKVLATQQQQMMEMEANAPAAAMNAMQSGAGQKQLGGGQPKGGNPEQPKPPQKPQGT